jgi:hypothetical protein
MYFIVREVKKKHVKYTWKNTYTNYIYPDIYTSLSLLTLYEHITSIKVNVYQKEMCCCRKK